ncbi:hypothetical protein VKT23_016698 [Stygiomarasmius scandens]|uniref:Uncharacterized protein n=1 Tax=Marasmiellus scandens TaxID=2682957 RepID=A0ABR1IXN0_9AGAR
MKAELGENWKSIDHRRDLAKRLGWVGYAQKLREEMASEEREKGVKLVTLKRCIEEFMKVAQMCYNLYGLILVGQLHDLNNHNRSRMFGWGPEYDRMMLSEKTVFIKELKTTAAKLRMCRDEIDAGLEDDPVKTELLREYEQGPDRAAVLRSLLPKLFKLDLAEATDNVVKSMKWLTFLRVACTHQLRMIDYPKAIPIIGPKSKGLISHAKDLSLPNLQEMITPRMQHFKACRKPRDTLTEDECDALVTTFRGTRIVPWLDEEKELPLEKQGGIPLMVDIDGNTLVTVAEVISSDGEAEEDEEETSTKSIGKGKGKAKAVVEDEEDDSGGSPEDHDSDRLPSIEPEPEARESIYRTLPISGRRIFTTPERQCRLGEAHTLRQSDAQVLPFPKPNPRPRPEHNQDVISSPPNIPGSTDRSSRPVITKRGASKPGPKKPSTFRPGIPLVSPVVHPVASSSRQVPPRTVLTSPARVPADTLKRKRGDNVQDRDNEAHNSRKRRV